MNKFATRFAAITLLVIICCSTVWSGPPVPVCPVDNPDCVPRPKAKAVPVLNDGPQPICSPDHPICPPR